MVTGADQPAVAPRTLPQALTQRTGQLMYELSLLYPPISGTCPAWSWAQPYDATVDGLPYLGPHRNFPRHFFALGDARHGPGACLAREPAGDAVGDRPAREGRRGLRVWPGALTGSGPGFKVARCKVHGHAQPAAIAPGDQHGQQPGTGDRPHPPPRRVRGDGRRGRRLRAAGVRRGDAGPRAPAVVTSRLPTTWTIRSASPATSASPRAGEFQPAVNINDARQRWLFRMVHTERPLQEKMALFWHNHFATALHARLPGDARRRPRRRACWRRSRPRIPAASTDSSSCSASTRSATSAICWSRSRRTPRCSCGSTAAPTCSAQPQENFARELMELFTMGVGTFAETDVYAGARVFTGWNLRAARQRRRAALHVQLRRRAARDHREGVHVPDLSGRQQDDPGARGGGRHAGRHRSDQRRRARIRRPARGWRASCTPSSSARSIRPTPALIDEMASRLLRAAASRSSR